LTAVQLTSRGGVEVEDVLWCLDVSLTVARREAMHAAKRADRLMQAGVDGAADWHRRAMAIVVGIDELREALP